MQICFCTADVISVYNLVWVMEGKGSQTQVYNSPSLLSEQWRMLDSAISFFVRSFCSNKSIHPVNRLCAFMTQELATLTLDTLFTGIFYKYRSVKRRTYPTEWLQSEWGMFLYLSSQLCYLKKYLKQMLWSMWYLKRENAVMAMKWNEIMQSQCNLYKAKTFQMSRFKSFSM